MDLRIIDVKTSEYLGVLHARCVEQGLFLSIDFGGTRPGGGGHATWLAQVFDHAETVLVSGRGPSVAVAVRKLHDAFFDKGMVA